jgi:hypothetical protein
MFSVSADEGSCQLCSSQDTLNGRQLAWDRNDSMVNVNQSDGKWEVVMEVANEVVEFRWRQGVGSE